MSTRAVQTAKAAWEDWRLVPAPEPRLGLVLVGGWVWVGKAFLLGASALAAFDGK